MAQGWPDLLSAYFFKKNWQWKKVAEEPTGEWGWQQGCYFLSVTYLGLRAARPLLHLKSSALKKIGDTSPTLMLPQCRSSIICTKNNPEKENMNLQKMCFCATLLSKDDQIRYFTFVCYILPLLHERYWNLHLFFFVCVCDVNIILQYILFISRCIKLHSRIAPHDS